MKVIDNNILKKRKGCFLAARVLNCKILLLQNTFKAKSIAAFKKLLDLSFENFVYQWLCNTTEMQPPLCQIPKLLIAMRKKYTLKPFVNPEHLHYTPLSEQSELCGSLDCSRPSAEEIDHPFSPDQPAQQLLS